MVLHQGSTSGQEIKHGLWKRAVTAVLCFGLLAALAPLGWAAGTQDKSSELANVKKQIDSTKAKISQTKKKENSILKELQNIEQNLDGSQRKLGRIERDLKVTSASVQQLQRDLVEAQKDLKQAEADLEGHYGRFGKRVRALYEIGPLTYLEIVFSANNFSDLIVRAELMERLIASDVRLYQQVQAEKREVEEKKAKMEQTKTNLESRQQKMAVLKGETAKEAGRLRTQVKERERVLARIQNERRELERALDEEEAMARELESVIRGLQKKSPSSVGSGPVGKMIWPVRGRISSEFGWRVHPILKTKRYHSGLDIAVPMGTPVAAATSGRVILSGWVGGYGKTVIIDHGGGISTLYGHNSSLLVNEGESVKSGEIIAKAGSTGLSTGPHVHFEVRRDGNVLNPHDWLP